MQSKIPAILEEHRSSLLSGWICEQRVPGTLQPGLISESEIRSECSEFLQLLAQATKAHISDLENPAYRPLQGMLAQLSRDRGVRGLTPSQTASFILSLKRPLFARLQKEYEEDAAAQAEEILTATALLDKLALFTTEVFQQTREEVIRRQQQDMLELSTPVVKLWDGILALPLIGTLDSNRTQIGMETLLERIVDTGSEFAIIDITGVPTVDTLVAQHLMKTAAAAKLMGVECIISGIRPQIAQTIVHLAVDLGSIVTKATLAEAFRLALKRCGAVLVRSDESAR